ncbi:MAG: hypothetical protein AAB554_03290 [Patescibacteria group bacterium]
MSDIEWKGLGDADVGFSEPCRGDYGWRRFSDPCVADDRDHGHLHLSDDGLVGRLPFCCRSQEGALALVDLLLKRGSLDAEQAAGVKDLEAFKRLPVALTAIERAELADPLGMIPLTRFCYVGA